MFSKVGQVLERYAGIEIHRAGPERVLPIRGILYGEHWLEVGVKNWFLKLGKQFSQCGRRPELRSPVLAGLLGGGAEFVRRKIRQELARVELVVIPLIPPKEHRIFGDLLEHGRIDAIRMRQNRLEKILLPEAVNGILVIRNR